MFTEFDRKIAVIGDIHIGKSKDSQIKQRAIDAAIDWMIEKCSQECVTTVIFAGDLHDNRNALTLTTLGESSRIIEKVSAKFKTIILAGNHDVAQKDGSSEILHSLHSFKHMRNVEIVLSSRRWWYIHNKKIVILPWGADIFDCKELNPDLLIGHFEYSGARIAGGVSKGNISMKDISTVAPLVMTGHYHIHEDKLIDGHRFICVGSLTELDWGDADTIKGIHIVDIQTMDAKFLECNLRPKHIYLTLSKLITKEEHIGKELIENNYVKLVIDIKIKYDAVRKLVNAINACNPIVPCIPEFQQTMTIDKPNINKIISDTILDKKQYILDYVDKIDTRNLSKATVDDVKKSLAEYYEKALQTVE